MRSGGVCGVTLVATLIVQSVWLTGMQQLLNSPRPTRPHVGSENKRAP